MVRLQRSPKLQSSPVMRLQLWHTSDTVLVLHRPFFLCCLNFSLQFFKSTNTMKLCVLSCWYQVYILISTGSELYVIDINIITHSFKIARLYWRNIRREDAGILGVFTWFLWLERLHCLLLQYLAYSMQATTVPNFWVKMRCSKF